MPEDNGEPTVNSTEAQSAVTAALDSVTVINNIVNNTDAVAGQSTAQRSTLNGAISAGQAYHTANS